jgi:hypothetical protein
MFDQLPVFTNRCCKLRLGRHGIARFHDCKCNFGLSIPLGSGTIHANRSPKRRFRTDANAPLLG